MRGVKLHGALLATALVWSLLLWTRESPTERLRERVVVWERDTTAVESISYRSSARDVDLSWQDDGSGLFLWGSEISRTRVFPAVAAGTSDSVAASMPADTIRVDTLAFPLGMSGADVVRNLATFRVVRDLGTLAGADANTDRFGVGDPYARLTIAFSDGERELLIGNQTPGGSDRYALDPSTGSLYVMPADVLGPLDTGAGALRERRLHYFLPGDVSRVQIEANGQARSMVRSDAGPGTPSTWSQPGSGEPDQTFANFMERVSQLAIEDFERGAAVSPTERRLRIDYFDVDDDPLGFVEVYRRSAPAGETYYLVSERTRVPALGIRSLAERVDLDLPQLF